jgi:hypothetical protein
MYVGVGVGAFFILLGIVIVLCRRKKSPKKKRHIIPQDHFSELQAVTSEVDQGIGFATSPKSLTSQKSWIDLDAVEFGTEDELKYAQANRVAKPLQSRSPMRTLRKRMSARSMVDLDKLDLDEPEGRNEQEEDRRSMRSRLSKGMSTRSMVDLDNLDLDAPDRKHRAMRSTLSKGMSVRSMVDLDKLNVDALEDDQFRGNNYEHNLATRSSVSSDDSTETSTDSTEGTDPDSGVKSQRDYINPSQATHAYV